MTQAELLKRVAQERWLWPRFSFIPWAVPAALFCVIGILFAHVAAPWWLLCPCLGCLLLVRQKPLRVLAITSLCLPLGYVRFYMWESTPNPLEAYYNQVLELKGISDGRYLQVEEPFRARVVLTPKEDARVGRLSVQGSLRRPETKRNPGGFDYRSYLQRRGVYGQVYIDVILEHEPFAWDIKERLRQGVIAGLAARPAGLMQAMTLGIRDDLNDLREVFAQSGLAHILALSGLHIGILVASLTLLSHPFGRYRYPIMMIIILAFVVLVGLTPSILRAAIMSLVVLASLWHGSGRLEAWTALSLSALTSLVFFPAWLFDLSFQLSYLAVAGILVCFRPLMARLGGGMDRPWWHWRTLLIANFTISLAAQLFTLPLVASTFNSVPLLSPLVNLIAIPLATLLVPLGFLAALAGLLSTALASFVNIFTQVLANILIATANYAAAFPTLTWGELSAIGYGFYGLVCLSFVLWLQNALSTWRFLFLFSWILLMGVVTKPPQAPELVFLDVGQGDSTLIRLPKRQEILVDGGGSPFSSFDVGANVVVPALHALDVDELELVIATHADADHIEGLVSVLDRIPTQRLLVGEQALGDEDYEALIEAAERNHVPIRPVVRGEVLKMGNAELHFLHPSYDLHEAVNDNSVAFVLNIAGASKALFLGDVSAAVEAELAIPDVDVLMVGHHGSHTSTSDYLLTAAQPETAVFSYGRNYYGHPHPQVMARLQALGVETRHTFLEGAVRISLD